MMHGIARIEAIILFLLALPLGAMTLVLGFFSYLSGSAPNHRLLAFNAGFAVATIVALALSWRLMTKPGLGVVIAGGVMIALAVGMFIADRMGFKIEI